MLGKLLDGINEHVTIKGGRDRETRAPGNPPSHSHICQPGRFCVQTGTHTHSHTVAPPWATVDWTRGRQLIQAGEGSLLWEFGVKGSKEQHRQTCLRLDHHLGVSVVPSSACPIDKATERASLPREKSKELTTERNTDQEMGRTFPGVRLNSWFL